MIGLSITQSTFSLQPKTSVSGDFHILNPLRFKEGSWFHYPLELDNFQSIFGQSCQTQNNPRNPWRLQHKIHFHRYCPLAGRNTFILPFSSRIIGIILPNSNLVQLPGILNLFQVFSSIFSKGNFSPLVIKVPWTDLHIYIIIALYVPGTVFRNIKKIWFSAWKAPGSNLPQKTFDHHPPPWPKSIFSNNYPPIHFAATMTWKYHILVASTLHIFQKTINF